MVGAADPSGAVAAGAETACTSVMAGVAESSAAAAGSVEVVVDVVASGVATDEVVGSGVAAVVAGAAGAELALPVGEPAWGAAPGLALADPGAPALGWPAAADELLGLVLPGFALFAPAEPAADPPPVPEPEPAFPPAVVPAPPP